MSKVRKASCSRENFSANLAVEIFSFRERTTCNVKGVLGKQKLDKARIEYIKQLTFDEYPTTTSENTGRCWANCVRAIDSKNQYLCRNSKRQLGYDRKAKLILAITWALLCST